MDPWHALCCSGLSSLWRRVKGRARGRHSRFGFPRAALGYWDPGEEGEARPALPQVRAPPPAGKWVGPIPSHGEGGSQLGLRLWAPGEARGRQTNCGRPGFQRQPPSRRRRHSRRAGEGSAMLGPQTASSRDRHPSAKPRVGGSRSAEQRPQLPVPVTEAPEVRAPAAGTR